MNEIQQNRYDQIIRRVGGIVGPGSKVKEVLAELFPMIDVENVPPELLALGGTRLAWASTERPASVGDLTESELSNPAGSGVIATVTSLAINTDIDALLSVGVNFIPIGAAPVRGVFRDSRFGGARETTLTVDSADAGVVTGGLTYRQFAEVLNQFSDDHGIAVLAPGSNLRVISTTQNVRMTVSYFWKERPAEQSELQF